MSQSRNSAHAPPAERRTRRLGLAAAALVMFTVACADAPSAPATAASARPSASLIGSVTGTLDNLVTVLTTPRRAKALQRDQAIAEETRTVTIGVAGGTIRLASAGLQVVVPAGAVSGPTAITVTAPAGRGVWYEFAPHGLKFAVPLQVTQDLRGTNYGALLSPQLQAAYFADGSRDEQQATALVTEVIGAAVNLFKTQVTFPVRHFSGYMVSWGFADSE